MGCVSFTETFLTVGARHYSDEGKPQYIGNPGDIVLATRQQSDNLPILGMPAIIPDTLNGGKIIVGSNLYMVENISDIDNKFIFWLLKTPQYINHIKISQTGTTVRMITKKDIENFTFLCPPKNEQDFISSLLWKIQNKIETNRKINARLEEMAQAIFKSWFIDFTPFGGQMPNDWELKPIDEVYSIKYGKNISKSELSDNGYPVYGANGIIGFTDKCNVNKIVTLITSRGNGSGEVSYTRDKDAFITNNSFIVFPLSYYKYLSFPYIYQSFLRIDFKSLCSGSAQPQLTNTSISSLSIMVPTKDIIDKFTQLCGAFYEKIFSLYKESARLAELRDALLPKLMSGEIKVEGSQSCQSPQSSLNS